MDRTQSNGLQLKKKYRQAGRAEKKQRQACARLKGWTMAWHDPFQSLLSSKNLVQVRKLTTESQQLKKKRKSLTQN